MPGTPGRTGNFHTSSDRTPQDGLPVKPKGISRAAGTKWKELLTQLPTQTLRRVDVHQLRLLCELLAAADVQAATVAADPLDHKTARLLLQTAQQIHRLSSCFGLTPADRARMQLPLEPDQPDEFQMWLASAMGMN